MEKSFWQARWEAHQTGFHQTTVHSALTGGQLFQSLHESAPAARVLVPLCGKSLDLLWLADQGFEVVGVEFVEQACEEFFDALQLTPARSSHAGSKMLCARGVTLVVDDFFAWQPAAAFEAVYDRAAFVAIEPSARATYAAKLQAVLKPGGRLLLVSFLHDTGSGPPHSIPDAEISRLFAPLFDLEKVSDRDILAEEPKFRDRGATFFREQVWIGTALAPTRS